MKRWLVAVLMMLSVGTLVAQKGRYSDSRKAEALDYPLIVHVTHARLMGQPASTLHLDVVISGKVMELEAPAGALIHTGEYQARVVTDDEKKSGWFSRSYELLFTDGTHVVFSEVAESE
jgi:hypothetical protein